MSAMPPLSVAKPTSARSRELVILPLRVAERQYAPAGSQSPPRFAPQISEHPPIRAFDFSENFINPCQHSCDKLDHACDLTAQLLYVALTFHKQCRS
jgi:hypothetical protein